MNVSRKKTLLFAEDEPELLEIYSEWFRRLGYHVLSAPDGQQAFSLCETNQVDLVISDVRMAGSDGIDLARRLKSELAESPLIVFLTGFADLSLEEAYDLGACAILNKPIQRAELEHAIARFLQSNAEIWRIPSSCQPEVEVRRSFDSLESAVAKKEMNLGRGGMFVRHSDEVPDNAALDFQFQFACGPARSIDGSGILRWQRHVSQHGLPPGLGIEILHLDQQALGPVVDWISRTTPRAFIPRE